MKTTALTGIFMLFTVLVIAQNKFSLAVNTQLGVFTGTPDQLSNAEFVNSYFDEPFDFSPTISYGGGLSLDYGLSSNWIARSGINYLTTRTEIQEYSVYGGAYDTNISFNNFNSNVCHQVQVPLSIVWQLGQSKYQPFVGGGILWSRFFLSKNSIVGLQQEVQLAPQRRNNAQWTINAGMNIQQKIGIELQYAFGTGNRVNTHREFLPFPCAVIAGLPPTGPCGNDYSAYSRSVFSSTLGLKITYHWLN